MTDKLGKNRTALLKDIKVDNLDLSNVDLDDFKNESADPYARLSEVVNPELTLDDVVKNGNETEEDIYMSGNVQVGRLYYFKDKIAIQGIGGASDPGYGVIRFNQKKTNGNLFFTIHFKGYPYQDSAVPEGSSIAFRWQGGSNRFAPLVFGKKEGVLEDVYAFIDDNDYICVACKFSTKEVSVLVSSHNYEVIETYGIPEESFGSWDIQRRITFETTAFQSWVLDQLPKKLTNPSETQKYTDEYVVSAKLLKFLQKFHYDEEDARFFFGYDPSYEPDEKPTLEIRNTTDYDDGEAVLCITTNKTYSTEAQNNANKSELRFNRGRGSHENPTAIKKGDAIGEINFCGHDGDRWWNSARFEAEAEEDFDLDTHAVRLRYRSRGIDDLKTRQRFVVDSNGNFGIGTGEGEPVTRMFVVGNRSPSDQNGLASFSKVLKIGEDGDFENDRGVSFLSVEPVFEFTDDSTKVYRAQKNRMYLGLDGNEIYKVVLNDNSVQFDSNGKVDEIIIEELSVIPKNKNVQCNSIIHSLVTTSGYNEDNIPDRLIGYFFRLGNNARELSDNIAGLALSDKEVTGNPIDLNGKWAIYSDLEFESLFSGNIRQSKAPEREDHLTNKKYVDENRKKVKVVSDNYTWDSEDVIIHTTSGSSSDVITIPNANEMEGRAISFVMHKDAEISQDYIDIEGNTQQANSTISGSLKIISDGINWYQIK